MQTFFCKGLLIFMLVTVLHHGFAYAQLPVVNKPTTQTQVGSTAAGKFQPLPEQPAININFVRTREALGRYTTEAAFDAADYTGVKQTTQFVDGLGRPVQSVIRQASPGATPKDLVSPIVYDAYGRQVYNYLPYVATTSDGAFKTNASSELSTFLQQQHPGEQMFYGKTIYEASPLNRVEKTFAPGNSWAGTVGEVSERSVQYKYMVNTAADEIRIWDINNNDLTYVNKDITTNIPVARPETYSEGQLYKNVMIDESGNAIVEYKDKEGQLILKKVQIGGIAADYSGYTGFLCTYYVYDDFGSLRFVIPPKAVAALIASGAWSLNIENVINELCFRYEYDHRQRMIAKKVPGGDWVYMVYDKRDRLVFSQDGNMRGKNQWMTTLYDELNRPVLTGMIIYTDGHQALQAYVTNIVPPSQPSDVTVTGTLPSQTPQNLVLHERTAGLLEYSATDDIIFEDGFESETTADFTASIILPQAGDPASTSILVWDNPIPSTSTLIALTETFYDNYNWTTKTYDISNNGKLSAGSNLHAETALTFSQQQAVGTLGLITGTRTRILEDPNDLTKGAWLESVNFYDDRGRVIQVQSINYKGGLDISTNLYDFSGKILCNYLVHRYPGGDQADLKVKTEMSYDAGGRLQEIWKTINDDNQNKTLIATMEYDAMGQLSKKSLGRLKDIGGTYTTTPVEELNYNYNIRGWLQGINKDQLGAAAPEPMTRWFSMELNYDWGFDKSQFNGNIAGTKWRTRGDQKRRSYGYNYDKANRILGGDFGQANSGTTYIDDARINFDILMGDGSNASSAYDENGNILSMTQYGLKGLQSKMIDQMTYRYSVGSNGFTNKLMSVRESASINDEKNGLGDFTDRFSEAEPQTTSTYAYDANGNMVLDLHKEIYHQIGSNKTDGIVYNHLNLPAQISVYDPTDNKEKGTISYIYDAAGNKLEKRVIEFPSSTNNNTEKNTRTTYIGGYVYENNQLQFFGHEEGRVRPEMFTVNNEKITKYHYDYFVKDHLGNTRMVLTEGKKQHIYPAATLEGNINATGQPNAINIEKDYYTIDVSNVVSRQLATGIPEYTNESNGISVNNPYSASTANSEKVYKLQSASGQAVTGLGITLKVMAGDQIDIFGKSYYFDNSTTGTHTPLNIESVIIGLFASGSSMLGTKALTENEMNADGVIASMLGSFLTDPNRGTDDGTSRPKAYINWILFDEQLQVAGSNFSRVAATGTMKNHFSELQGIEVTSNGYLYVYCSNESSKAVFFDNLQVVHTSGPLVEETHYYPFGLTQQGISPKAAGNLTNKFKFGGKELNNNEFSDGGGLELYDFSARMYDHQAGHFPNPDPLADRFSSWSPYVYSYNNPIRFGDPTGMSSYDWVQTADGQMKWDDRVTNDESAVKYYGEGSTYRVPGYSYTSSSGAVTLGDNQQYTLNGVNKTAVNSTPGLGDRIGFEIINWFNTTNFAVEGKAKVSVGAQIGVSGNVAGIQGKFEAGVQTFDLAEASYDITEMSGHVGASAQRVHNFIGAEGKFFSDRLRVGLKYDYTYEYFNSYYGPKMEDGTATHDWSLSLPFKNFGPKIKLADNMISTQMKASAIGQSTNDKSFYGVDVGASLKVILGVELKLKIGFNR